MPITKISDKLLSWASVIDENTIEQALKTSRLPFVEGHVALMPDAHLGKGSTVGSVFATRGAIIPSAIGVDIGCGMAAIRLNLWANQLPDELKKFLDSLHEVVPAGVGKGKNNNDPGIDWFYTNWNIYRDTLSNLDSKQFLKLTSQYGSLGSGNHFVELCLDQNQQVWLLLHSGSRGIGNELATKHIAEARGLMKRFFIDLPDPDLAYLVEDTPEFKKYIADMQTCQRYALDNRAEMLRNALAALETVLGRPLEREQEINCHHNFTQKEHVFGHDLWVTRKGAISARTGAWGLIPGSMGTASYVVQGRGSEASLQSCSHGAGRRLSRSAARRQYSIQDLQQAMSGVKTWQSSKASDLLDEIPDSYKDIDQVMADQADLVEIKYSLHQILNYKGTN